MSKLKQQLDAQSLETQAEQDYRSLKTQMDKSVQKTEPPATPKPTFRQPENEQSEPSTQTGQAPNGRIPSPYRPNKLQTENEQDTDMEY